MSVIERNITERFSIVTCWSCGIRFGTPQEFDTGKTKTKEVFYCPNGHSCAYTESEADRLKRQLIQANQQLDQEKERARQAVAEKESAERRLAAAHAQVSRARNESAIIKKRVGNGVCPCCNRTFCNLQRHMTTKHPEYKNPTGE